MYDAGPSDQELQALGFRREDVVAGEFHIWPENWVPYLVFVRVSSQWRMSQCGPTGLDYNVVLSVLDLMRVKRKLETLDAIRVMESSALKQLSKS
jgi:hypothetical protein